MPSNELVIRCSDLMSALEFYTAELGFRTDMIFPADAPRIAVLSGHGLSARLECEVGEPVDATMPASDWEIQRASDEAWGTGRAGMQYRDLIPDRRGGDYIASHIRIPVGGPVPDYVHHHHVRFQTIYCYKGWVKVVYEDQGPAFVMREGDCVLQPPHIRHRVLECSDNMQVVEVSSPAEHETFVDHDMSLPTASIDAQRQFGGQRFVRHQAGDVEWAPAEIEGFDARDTGIFDASSGLASVRVLKPTSGTTEATLRHTGDFCFVFVLSGSATLGSDDFALQAISPGDSFLVPSGKAYVLNELKRGTSLLLVASAEPPA